MAKYKGAGLAALKKQIVDLGSAKEQELLAKLTPEEKQVYTAVLSSAWLPIDIAAHLLQKGAEVISPGNPDLGLHQIGLFQARYNLAGIYKPLMRITTVYFVVQQAAKLWTTYFDRGQALAVKVADKNLIEFSVDDFPELPYSNRRIVNGFIEGTLEFTGTKNIRVTHQSENSQSWKWHIIW
ncbi:MAG: hypothetical protein HGA76_09945 [Candidatus Firestonebacteria bacterium]|nr:hypothetical protein [Candidatus Firestonebacteria bacterium]